MGRVRDLVGRVWMGRNGCEGFVRVRKRVAGRGMGGGDEKVGSMVTIRCAGGGGGAEGNTSEKWRR